MKIRHWWDETASAGLDGGKGREIQVLTAGRDRERICFQQGPDCEVQLDIVSWREGTVGVNLR